MPIFQLRSDSLLFPPVELAEPEGEIAVGGDFSPERLVCAYASGIFPWFVWRGQILWYSPDPRMVLRPKDLNVGRSLAKIIRRGDYEVRLDTDFDAILQGCAEVERPRQNGTWISEPYKHGFKQLFEKGIAHCVGAYYQGELVGGLYGMALGKVFFGESMFARRPDASKVAFATFVRQLELWGFELIDCQQETSHLARFGAQGMARADYIQILSKACALSPSIFEGDLSGIGNGPWSLELSQWDGRTTRSDGAG